MEVEKYLDKYVSKKEFRKEYQKYRKIFLKALDNPEVFISNLSNELYENYIRRNKIISEYYKRMKEVDKNNELTNTISRIAMTFSHMFCNRVNGNRIWERQLLALTRHTVHDYIQKERNIINNK